MFRLKCPNIFSAVPLGVSFANEVPMCQLITSLPAAFNAADLLMTFSDSVLPACAYTTQQLWKLESDCNKKHLCKKKSLPIQQPNKSLLNQHIRQPGLTFTLKQTRFFLPWHIPDAAARHTEQTPRHPNGFRHCANPFAN